MNINNFLSNYTILFFLLYIVSNHSHPQITFRILQSSVLHFIPAIKLHHIVLLSDKPEHYLYTLDFTPINQTHRATLLKMLFARSVPAEIRLHRPERKMRQNPVMICIFYNYVSNNLTNAPL